MRDSGCLTNSSKSGLTDLSKSFIASLNPFAETIYHQGSYSVEIIDSNFIETNLGTRLAFRGWNYAHILIRLLLDVIDEEICIDIGCGITLADRSWLLELLSHVKIRRITLSLRVKGLGSAMHDTAKYVLISMYISVIKEDDIKVLCRIHREIHLVDNLKAHMLLSNDVIGSKKIVLDIF